MSKQPAQVNLYAVQGRGKYGGGVATVLAESASSARVIAVRVCRDPIWNTDYSKGDIREIAHDVRMGNGKPFVPQVLDHFELGE